MPSFQIKDLTVILNPQNAQVTQQLCRFGCTVFVSQHCHFACSHFITHIECHWGCSFQISCHWGCSLQLSCRWACSNLGPSIPTPTIIEEITSPLVLEIPNLKKSELEGIRSGIADLQRKVEEQLKNAPDDLELLEGKLKEALDEVQKQRGNTQNS